MRVPFLAALVLLFGTSAASPVRSAPVRHTRPEPASGAPTVTITPAGGTWSGSSAALQLDVKIEWCDDTALNAGSRAVLLDGAPVTAGFSYTAGSKAGCGAYAVSRDTLSLAPGAHTLEATIWDVPTVGEPYDGSAFAQYTYIHTPAQPAPTYGVSVSPETGSATVGTSSRATQVFTVQNTGSQAASFAVGVACTGAASGCAATAARITLEPAASALAAVAYTASAAAGQAGTVKLWATREGTPAPADTGVVQVATQAPAPPGTVAGAGDGTTLERGLCVAASAGAGAAFECGDLRLGHGLPATRHRGRVRAPVLTYNSQHGRPYPIVALDLAPRAGTRPDTIRAVLRLSSDGATFPAWWPGWPSDTLKRISMGFDPGTRGTGVYDYTLTVTAHWNGGASEALGTFPGRLVIVDRRQSEFGAGWWLAGLEQLRTLDGGELLWIGGDGSHRVYRPDPTAAGRWGADPFLRPDSIVLRTDAAYPERTRYARILPGRAEVRFDSWGKHRETVSARGDTTWFEYDGEGRLDLVRWSGAGGNGYDFRYPAPGAPLSVVATWGAQPGTERVVRVLTDGYRRVTSITDPDSGAVGFGYPAGSARALVTSRTNRENATTGFVFDAGSKLWRSTLALKDAAASPADSVNIRFTPVETRGWWPAPVPTAHGYVLINGPRLDVNDATAVWVDRRGLPVRVVTADAASTTLVYGDPRWPGAVTEVRYQNGRVVSATYDARGNLESSTDWSSRAADGRYATTLYRWDPYWDHVVQVTAPEGETTHTGLDAKGRVAWVQPGGTPARRTSFAYHPDTDPAAPGLPQGVKPPLSGWETYEYDTGGNLRAVVSPLGIRSTTYADRIGRDTLIVPPQGARTRTVYDASERPARTVTWSGSDSLVVTSTYDREGRPRFVTRAVVPNSSGVGAMTIESRYDRAGRKTAELAPDFATDSMVYNPAGQVVRVLTRRYAPGRGRLAVEMEYDLMGRLVRRIVPGDTFITRQKLEFDRAWRHPRLPLSPYLADPNQIPADTSVFAYDLMGNLTAAGNGAALVRRAYAQNGALLSETQKIFPYAGSRDSTAHVYTLRYRYDLDGRRVALGLSPNLMPAGRDTVRYGFDAATGALASVADPYAGAFAFGYDAEGRLAREDRPGGIWEWREYDPDGRMVKRGLNGPYSQRDSLVLDPLGRVREAHQSVGVALAAYNAFGAMVDWDQRARGTEYLQPRVDPLGNTLREYRYAIGETQEHATITWKTHGYSTRTGRLTSTRVWADSSQSDQAPQHEETSQYDDAGNRTWFSSSAYYGTGNGTLQERTASFFTADGKLRVVDRQRCMTAAPIGAAQAICTHWDSNQNQDPGVFEEYRYDALGRRVLVRTRPERTDAGVAGCTVAECPASITRTVWDGDQVAAELRTDGEGTASALENDQDIGPQYGKVVYTHGPGIDAPLALTRFGYDSGVPVTVVPHANWRGLYEGGTFEDGTRIRGTLNLSTLDWSGVNTSAFFGEISPTERDRWFGSLIGGMRDGSGQLYRRNRYFDPGTGRFTQEDPIGLGGGLNLYAFGGGDPVTYSDPYGQSACLKGTAAARLAFAGGAALSDGPLPIGDVVALVCVVGVVWMAANEMDRHASARRAHAVSQANESEDRPALDGTGKVHGTIPGSIPDEWTEEDMEELRDELEKSIRTRQAEQQRLGEHGPHRERLRQEERLLRQIQKRLSGS